MEQRWDGKGWQLNIQTKTRTSSHITNAKVRTAKNGLSTTKFALVMALLLNFVLHNQSRAIIRDVSGTSTIHTSNSH